MTLPPTTRLLLPIFALSLLACESSSSTSTSTKATSEATTSLQTSQTTTAPTNVNENTPAPKEAAPSAHAQIAKCIELGEPEEVAATTAPAAPAMRVYEVSYKHIVDNLKCLEPHTSRGTLVKGSGQTWGFEDESIEDARVTLRFDHEEKTLLSSSFSTNGAVSLNRSLTRKTYNKSTMHAFIGLTGPCHGDSQLVLTSEEPIDPKDKALEFGGDPQKLSAYLERHPEVSLAAACINPRTNSLHAVFLPQRQKRDEAFGLIEDKVALDTLDEAGLLAYDLTKRANAMLLPTKTWSL